MAVEAFCPSEYCYNCGDSIGDIPHSTENIIYLDIMNTGTLDKDYERFKRGSTGNYFSDKGSDDIFTGVSAYYLEKKNTASGNFVADGTNVGYSTTRYDATEFTYGSNTYRFVKINGTFDVKTVKNPSGTTYFAFHNAS